MLFLGKRRPVLLPLAVLCLIAAESSCDLNPQPLPPGETATDAATSGPGPIQNPSDAGGSFNGADSSSPIVGPGTDGGGAGNSSDASAADGGVGGDAASQDAGDAAPSDGATDASAAASDASDAAGDSG